MKIVDVIKESALLLGLVEEELFLKEITEEKINYSNVLPATPAQMRVYTAQMMNPEIPLYNISYVFETEVLDAERLESIIDDYGAKIIAVDSLCASLGQGLLLWYACQIS